MVGLLALFVHTRIDISYAQVTPTFNYIAPCPMCSSPGNAPVVGVSGGPTVQVNNPTGGNMSSPAPSAVPCEIVDTSIVANDNSRSHPRHKKNNGDISGMMKALMKFFLELLNMLLKLIGERQIPVPVTSPSPNQNLRPSDRPEPSLVPCQPSEVPTGAPTQVLQPTISAFLTSSVPMPTTSTIIGGKPNASNTGVPVGTHLTVVTGDQTYSTDNQVISGLDIHGKVTITGNNVTLKSSIVRGSAGSGCANGAVIVVKGSGTIIQDTEVVLLSPIACLDGVWASNATLLRMNIHAGVDGVKAGSNTKIEASFIHDMNHFASDPNQGGGATHNDAIQILKGSNITVSGNTLNPGSNGNAAIQVTQDFGTVSNFQANGNWADGGNCTFNFAHKVGSSLAVTANNNKFGRNSRYNCPILLSAKTTLTGSGNVWEDTNQPISAPK
jgi:hypothetical protein